jgi:hypothetical protein
VPAGKHFRGVSSKEQRQYEHVKESAEKSGRYGSRAEEAAARTVMKEHKEKGPRRRKVGFSAQFFLQTPEQRVLSFGAEFFALLGEVKDVNGLLAFGIDQRDFDIAPQAGQG